MRPRRRVRGRAPSPSPAREELTHLVLQNRAAALGASLRALARTSVAASTVFLGACALPVELPPELGTPVGPLCVDARWSPLARLRPARSYDYVALYDDICGGCADEADVRHSHGELCATAPDRGACEREVATSRTLGPAHLVVTEGQTVERFFRRDPGPGAFLGPIDTPDEALVVVFLAGYSVTCTDGAIEMRQVDGGYQVIASIEVNDCPVTVERHRLRVSADGALSVLGRVELPSGGGCAGRRPAGLRAPVARSTAGPAARYFADVARLEASSVTAFERLAAELEAHRAPRALVEEARRAASDEVRHAQMMSRVARCLGAVPEPARVDPRPVRPLFEVVVENEIEGCVRETFGALVAHHQAEAALDVELRAMMESIAEDETRHAALAWAFASWAAPRLTPAERASIRRARLGAVADLRAEWGTPRAPALIEWAGLPSPNAARGLLHTLASTTWSHPIPCAREASAPA